MQRDVDREDIDSQTMDFAKTLVNVEQRKVSLICRYCFLRGFSGLKLQHGRQREEELFSRSAWGA